MDSLWGWHLKVNRYLYKTVQICGHLFHNLKILANQHEQVVIRICSVLGYAKDEFGGQAGNMAECC